MKIHRAVHMTNVMTSETHFVKNITLLEYIFLDMSQSD